MAKQKAGFVDEHIEKVVIGVCAIVLGGVIWYSFLSDRFAINGVSPTQLCQNVGEETDRTAQAIQNARLTKDGRKAPPESLERLPRWFSDGLIAVDELNSPAGRTQPFPPLFVSAIESSMENRVNLIRLVRPGIPVVTSGETAFKIPEELPDLSDYDGPDTGQGPSAGPMRHWASIVAQLDLNEQKINFGSANYPDRSYLPIVKVHLQRLDETEPDRDWQDVEPFLPFQSLNRPALDSAIVKDWEQIRQFKTLIASKQEHLARTKLPPRASGDKLKYPEIPYYPDTPRSKNDDDTNKRVRGWLSAAKKAYKNEDFDAAFILSQAVIETPDARGKDIKAAEKIRKDAIRKYKNDPNRREFVDMELPEPALLMPIAAHDLGVIPGHVYRYRIRYEIFNIFAGQPNELKNRDDAAKLTLFSDWSPSSRPVEIESDITLYLTKANRKRREATVTVRKKTRSGEVRADFKVTVGDEIGGKKTSGRPKGDFTSGAVCVDIDFARVIDGKRDVVLVYVDKPSGHLRELRLSLGKKASEKFAKK